MWRRPESDRFERSNASPESCRQFEALLVNDEPSVEGFTAAVSASDDVTTRSITAPGQHEDDMDVEEALDGGVHPQGTLRKNFGNIGGRSKLLCAAALVAGSFVATTAFVGGTTAGRVRRIQTPVPTAEALVNLEKDEDKRACHDAVQGEACYKAIDWAMIHGIHEHQAWYKMKDGGMLTAASTFSDFQAFLHEEGRGACPAPCETINAVAEEEAAATDTEPELPEMITEAAKTAATTETAATEDEVTTTSSESTEEDVTITNASTTTAKPRCAKSESEDCTASKCCLDPGMQCYSKNDFWASCRRSCLKGPRPVDPDASPWACEELGERTPGEPLECADDGQDCSDLKCCKGTGMQCYYKNKTRAVCKSECTPGPDLTDEDWQSWSCDSVGPRKPGPSDWVAQQCSADGADCTQSQCCMSMGKACFEKQPHAYAACKASCTPGPDPNAPWDKTKWTCKQLGEYTPKAASQDGAQSTGQVASWVEGRCSGEQDDCTKTRCCKAVAHACYQKNKYWSQCMESCPHEVDPKTNKTAWTCNVLGPRSWGLATKGFPALFCLSVMRVTGYEPGLMSEQLKRGLGIFACDGFLVVANGNISLGYLPGSKKLGNITTWPIPTIPVGRSQDGTAANTLLFMKVWDAVLTDGRYRNYDWTIKADPDAVVMADRLRLHLAPHNGENVYFVNCNAYPNSPNFPMMYGSLEVFSRLAMLSYSKGSGRCGSELPWKAWGEDYFMTHCLDLLGVGRVGDFQIIGDNVCAGADCAHAWTAAFHPFKTVESWTNCLNTALSSR